MKSSTDIRNYLSRAKQKMTETTQAWWAHYLVQSAVQGFAAPIYSYFSFIENNAYSKMFNESLSVVRYDNTKLNMVYAGVALVTTGAYRTFHYGEERLAQQTDSILIKSPIEAVDKVAFIAGNAILMIMLGSVFIKSISNNLALTRRAKRTMVKSYDFQPAESVDLITTGSYSTLLYIANCSIQVTSLMLSFYSTSKTAQVTSFLLESVGAGYLLSNHKFSAADLSSNERKRKWQQASSYIIFYGASCVAAARAICYPTTWFGVDNYYTSQAVFNAVFSWYQLLAISRQAKYPGEGEEPGNLWEKIQPVVQRGLKKLLKETTLNELINSKEVSRAVVEYEEDIRAVTDYSKQTIKKIDKVQTGTTASWAKWVNQYIPFIPVPVLKFLNLNKSGIAETIANTEDIVEAAKIADAKHNGLIPKDADLTKGSLDYYSRLVLMSKQDQSASNDEMGRKLVLPAPKPKKDVIIPAIVSTEEQVESQEDVVPVSRVIPASDNESNQESQFKKNIEPSQLITTNNLVEPTQSQAEAEAVNNSILPSPAAVVEDALTVTAQPSSAVIHLENKPVASDVPVKLNHSLVQENYFDKSTSRTVLFQRHQDSRKNLAVAAASLIRHAASKR